MEMHLIMIMRFLVCFIALVAGGVVMFKADDRAWMRRSAAVLGVAAVIFNEKIGSWLYLLVGGLIESSIALMGVGFVVILAAVIMLFPLIFVVRWLIH